MSTAMKIFLSMSCSGGLLILALLLGGRVLRDKISRQWQYYIWLVAVLRLLLPFGPQVSLLGKAYQAVDQAIARAESLAQSPQGGPASLAQSPQQSASQPGSASQSESASQPGSASQPESASLQPPSKQSDTVASGGLPVPAVDLKQKSESVDSLEDDKAAIHSLRDIGRLLIRHLWLVWLMAAMGLLVRKITIYQSFVRYINAGSAPVSDMETLDRLSIAAERAGVKKPIELCVNSLISSPLLIGFFRPCIVLPSADISEKDFQYIILHELTHYKRGDMFYKWLVQITVCLHWFNPLVHLMSREIARACEFSCDEAVLAQMGEGSARDYGKTLLEAMAAVGRYRKNPGTLPLSENKQLLKERLEALMNFRERSGAVRIFTAALTLCVVLGAAFIGVYTRGTAAGKVQAAPLFGALPDAAGVLSGTTGALQDTTGALSGTTNIIGALPNVTDRSREDNRQQATGGGRIWHPQVIPVNLETMAEGEIAWLGEYALTDGDRIWYAVTAEAGKGLQVGFVKPGDESLNEIYYSMHNLRQEGEPLECIASTKFGDPVEPGTYRLFLWAPDGALENVRGSISIGFKAEAEAY